jgi:hypothetical protein
MTKVSNTVKFWPPTAWASSYSGTDPLLPNVATAVLQDAVVRDKTIRLRATDQRHSFTAVVEVRDPSLLASVAHALSSARGKTLPEVGDVLI